VVSLIGVLVILLHGDLTTLSKPSSSQQGDPDLHGGAGDLRGFYSVLSLKRPNIHPTVVRSPSPSAPARPCLIPLLIWELYARAPGDADRCRETC